MGVTGTADKILPVKPHGKRLLEGVDGERILNEC
jgi:hypothetical protein